MKYAYHYYAIHQSKPGEVAHVHGFFTREAQVSSAEDYLELCKAIGERNKVDPERLTICSLSIVSTTP